MQLTLVYKLIEAGRKTGLDVRVINSAFPDGVHPVIARIGLAPTTGIGNVANPILPIRSSVAHRLRVSMTVVKILLVAHHNVSPYLPPFGSTGGVPYYLKTVAGDRDVTEDVNFEPVFKDLPTRFRRPGGGDGQILTASSALGIILAIVHDTVDLMHAPRP